MWKVILVGVAFTAMHLAYAQGKSLNNSFKYFKLSLINIDLERARCLMPSYCAVICSDSVEICINCWVRFLLSKSALMRENRQNGDQKKKSA